ncbi:hypothetical protein AAFN75_05870 [Algibacter sp. AS12]|uniref:hypothetical protein n=1 Tax=Algibacter sp. AS12 TaxID=3135773 RepID=UPI00398B8D3F
MKPFIILFFLSFTCLVFSQSGTYKREPKHTDGTKIKWTLKLKEDGSFLYHFLRDLSTISKENKEENFYGKGTWKHEGNQILFYSKPSDLNAEFSVNLNNSKARYITKSPRDKSDKIVKTALRFYESDTFHIEGLTVFKE